MKKVKTSFGKFAELWDMKTGDTGFTSNPLSLQALLDSIGKVKGKRVYEIATGNGFLARKFVKAGAKEVWASDISPELIAIAETKYHSHKITYSVRDGSDVKNLPKNYFDIVVINLGVFFISDLDALFEGVHSVLKPGGAVVFSIMHPLFWVSRTDMGFPSVSGKNIPIKDVYKKYLTSYVHLVKKQWQPKDKQIPVEYYSYNRPLNAYINALGKHRLYVSEISEPKSISEFKGKKLKSDIPGNLIIKAVKV